MRVVDLSEKLLEGVVVQLLWNVGDFVLLDEAQVVVILLTFLALFLFMKLKFSPEGRLRLSLSSSRWLSVVLQNETLNLLEVDLENY